MVNPMLVVTTALASTCLAPVIDALKTITLTHPSGSTAEVFYFGAHVKSFQPAMKPKLDILFMSKKSNMDGEKPIRGGIPIVWPNFGSAEGLPGHGFARITNWTLVSHEDAKEKDGVSTAIFKMEASESTRKMWPNEFKLEYWITLHANQLDTALHVRNTDKKSIQFHALLHNYLWIDDVRNDGAQVNGLKGVDYFDKVSKTNMTETREYITITKDTDSVYKNAPDRIDTVIKGVDAVDRTVTVEKSGSIRNGNGKGEIETKTDVVVWNPYTRAANITDMGAEEYMNFLAIEPGRVSEHQELGVGMTYILKQSISVSSL
ncbi:hypothetical protein CCR75_001288 [Bremia lactucae]|uniref:glucose-6-phosphate 1-epimerase n=1 Tax=Bremia lactucae TaxID=4779 RepID=A0A976FMX2_BRELC|nr:hypothetical protein CCR75_001288 [Bremia lactucae]